ncbi:MAG: biotin/lipoyl-binding protein, partial [Bdellovibrionales bacterium]|nr:biotin/lipoyl-binding protein [Massilia sp.]
MAQIEVKVPVLSESVAEATLLAWHKKVGEPVSRDENLIDIETDKVVLELPAPAAGVITQILKADGSTVMAGEVIAIIDTEGTAKVSPLEVSTAPVQTAPEAPAAAPAAPKVRGPLCPSPCRSDFRPPRPAPRLSSATPAASLHRPTPTELGP